MKKVVAIPVTINGEKGYDICIYSEEATVQDYIDALDTFIDNQQCFRSRNPELDSCYACNLCCQERIPVTIIDALKLPGNDIKKSILDFLNVYVDGPIVDITLRLNDEGKCHFLNREKGICGNYNSRSMVCHTFICCPSTPNAKKLREEIVNAGEDELVRSWFKIRDNAGRLIIHEGIRPQPDLADYDRTAFSTALEYSQVKLRDICSRALWKKIYKK